MAAALLPQDDIVTGLAAGLVLKKHPILLLCAFLGTRVQKYVVLECIVVQLHAAVIIKSERERDDCVSL